MKSSDIINRNAQVWNHSNSISAVINQSCDIVNEDNARSMGIVDTTYRFRYPVGYKSKLFLSKFDDKIKSCKGNLVKLTLRC